MTVTRATRGSEGGSNPEYVYGRVRSRRAALFDDEDYRKLVRMGPGGIARYMEESEYETEINALGARHSGVDLIEYALNRNLARHFEDLLRWATGRLHDLIARYLRTYDAWNVKTIVRGVYTDATAEGIRTDLIMAGELDQSLLESLVEAESIEQVVDGLAGTIFGDPLREAYDDYEAEGVLVPLENAVDQAFYSRLLAETDTTGVLEGPMALYVEFLQAEIDFTNVRNALRLSRSGAEVDLTEYFIEGGRLFTASQLRSLVGDTDQLVEHVRASTYGDELSATLDDLDAAESLIEFEHALDAALLEYADQLSNTYPVSVTSVLSYVLAKEREVENIRAIARGREAGLDEDEIQQELVFT